jgi:hypothetical protein
MALPVTDDPLSSIIKDKLATLKLTFACKPITSQCYSALRERGYSHQLLNRV